VETGKPILARQVVDQPFTDNADPVHHDVEHALRMARLERELCKPMQSSGVSSAASIHGVPSRGRPTSSAMFSGKFQGTINPRHERLAEGQVHTRPRLDRPDECLSDGAA